MHALPPPAHSQGKMYQLVQEWLQYVPKTRSLKAKAVAQTFKDNRPSRNRFFLEHDRQKRFVVLAVVLTQLLFFFSKSRLTKRRAHNIYVGLQLIYSICFEVNHIHFVLAKFPDICKCPCTFKLYSCSMGINKTGQPKWILLWQPRDLCFKVGRVILTVYIKQWFEELAHSNSFHIGIDSVWIPILTNGGLVLICMFHLRSMYCICH